MKFTVKQIAHLLNGVVQGDDSLIVSQLSKIEDGSQGDISFLANAKYEPFLYTTNATAVIVSQDFEPKKDLSTTLIVVENAYIGFTQLLEEYQNKIIGGASLDILFIMDCTLSMGTWINTCKNELKSIITTIKSDFPNSIIRGAFVGIQFFYFIF